MLIALTAAFILPDLPHNTRGFSEDELRVAQIRMIEDVGEADVDSEQDGMFTGLIMCLKDAKIYLMILASFLFVCGLTFNAYFVSFGPLLDAYEMIQLTNLTPSPLSHKHLATSTFRHCS